MDKWEYRVIQFDYKRHTQYPAEPDGMEKVLGSLGAQGWEAVSMTYTLQVGPLVLLKRRKP